MIRLENLTKYYGTRLAVDSIDVNIQGGEIVGFLGPNGAGKSTTMRMITGYLMPTSGQVFVSDLDMRTQSLEARRLIGYMPEIVPLYRDMTTRQYLEYVARLRGVGKKQTAGQIDRVVEICHLEEYIDVILGKLSKGFRQRVGLAQSIIHEPEVLILDEPTVGIDPIQVAQTRELIRELGKEHTILLSTHILPEVSMICERVIIIHQGRIVAEDRIENLSSVLRGGSRLRVRVDGPTAEVIGLLQGIPGVQTVSFDHPYHMVAYSSEQGEQAPHGAITQAIVQKGWTLLAMESADMSLEDIFLQLTTKEEADR